MAGKALLILALLALLPALPAGDEVSRLLAEGDGLLRLGQDDPAHTAPAVARYRAALQASPASYEIHCRLACGLYYLGLEMANRKERSAVLQEGIRHARQAIGLRFDRVEGHFWLGVLYAKLGETKGVLKSLMLIDDIRAEMKTSLAIDPGYGRASAYAVLGRIHFLLPGILGGSNSKALALLEAGRALAPDNTTILLYLAELYWDMDRRRPACELLRQILSAPAPDPPYREFHLNRIAAAALLPRYSRSR